MKQEVGDATHKLTLPLCEEDTGNAIARYIPTTMTCFKDSMRVVSEFLRCHHLQLAFSGVDRLVSSKFLI